MDLFSKFYFQLRTHAQLLETFKISCPKANLINQKPNNST